MLYQDRRQSTTRRFSALPHSYRYLLQLQYPDPPYLLKLPLFRPKHLTLFTVLSFSFTLVTEIEPNLDDILRTDTLLLLPVRVHCYDIMAVQWHAFNPLDLWLSFQLGRGKCCTKMGSKSRFSLMA